MMDLKTILQKYVKDMQVVIKTQYISQKKMKGLGQQEIKV